MEQDDRNNPSVMWQNVETWLSNQHEKFDELMAHYPDAESRATIIKELGECVVDLCWKLHRSEVDDSVVTISREEYRDLLEYKARYEGLCK